MCSVADRVDRSVFDDDSLVADEQDLKRHNDSSEERLVTEVVEHVLSVHHVVHRDHCFVFFECARSHSSQLEHVCSGSSVVADVDAQRSDVGAGLTADPEDAHFFFGIILNQLALVDRPDSQHFLDCRDQRRSLKHRASQCVERLDEFVFVLDRGVQLDDAHVLFTSRLLRLDESGGSVETDDETACDLGV